MLIGVRGSKEGFSVFVPDFPDFLAVLGPGRCLKSFLETVRFISTHREPVASHGDPFRVPGQSTFLQVVVLRILVSDIFWIFGLS